MDLLCTESSTSLLFPMSPKHRKPPCSGGPPVQEHTSSESYVSECPMESDPEELKKSSVVYGHAGHPHASHKG